MLSANLSKIRKDYLFDKMSDDELSPEPLKQFSDWIQNAVDSGQIEPTAMTLATVDSNGVPDARVVLLKGIDRGLVFYSNYNSAKGKQIELNNSATVVFHWPHLERQVRIKGTIDKTTREQSEQYFSSRPLGSQVSAIVSNQSEKITDREALDRATLATVEKKEALVCPDHWGGYRLIPNYFEFWQGRENRLHDRICYEQNGDRWGIHRLSP